MKAAVFPQPAGSSTAGRPTHGPWNRSRDGRRRAHGRAHGHTPGARRNCAYRTRTSVRTTIPPSGRMPLNAWDAANYAGFTNAAWLCQSGSRLCRGGGACPGSNAGRTKNSAPFSPSRESATLSLARRVNDLGAQRGLTLRYDKTSVARWVSKGMVPQGAAPHLIAAAIGQKLGRPVPLHEIGLADADPAPEVGLAFPRDVGQAVKSATELYRLDLVEPPGGLRRHLAVARRVVRGERVRHARLTVADNPGRQLGRARGEPVRRLRRTAQSRPQRCTQTAGGRGGRPALGLQVRRRRLAFVDGPRVPEGRGGPAAARLLLRRRGPLPLRRGGRTHPSRGLDGVRHRPAGGGAALLHPGAAPGPCGGRRAPRRLRPGVDVAPGDVPRLRRRGRGSRPGGAGAQPRPGHRPDPELLPPRRGTRARARRGRAGRPAPPR